MAHAHEEIKQSITCQAGSDLSTTGQYLFVELASDNQVDVVSSAGGDAVGVLQNDPSAAGQAATVAVSGVTIVECGETMTAGQLVSAGADGKAILADTSTHIIHGKCIVGGASGEKVSVLLKPGGHVA